MAKYFKYLILSFFHFLIFSCQEGGDAGDLFGQWRLAGSDTKYISFSGSITWIKSLNENELYGNFQHVGDSLFIQCYSIKGIPVDTALVENSFGFKPFNNIRMKIESLSSDHLLLRKDNQTWLFDKY
ncbi:MAG: lipocalin-like domain-containing protein [Prevotella sp.]|nr:lipocalin-like domain-containing protein [Prevotella sp.]